MATLKELLLQVADNKPLDPTQRGQLANIAQDLDDARQIFRTWQRPEDKRVNTNYLDLPFAPIYSQVLEQDMASLTIQIPSGYKHLMIMGQGRINGSSGQDAVMSLVQINGDTGNNYIWGHMLHTSTTVSAAQDTSDPYIPFIYMIADGWAAGPAGNAFMFIPHYTSGYHKNILIVGSAYGTNVQTAVRNGSWKSTAAIQSIKIYPDPTYPNAKLEAGSLISIYGIQ